MPQSCFPANLRFLCSYKPSIAHVCRDLKVNRSQFNRYLAGTSAPRSGLLRQICDYFGVEFHEVLLPENDFENLIKLRGVPEVARTNVLERHFGRILELNQDRAFELKGMFFEYYHSMSMPGSVLRSLIVFEPRDGALLYRRLERIGPHGQVCRRHYRYHGLAVMLGDRIFLTDYEYGLKVEMTHTILYPDYSSRVSTLIGVKVGVGAHRQRTPCGARVYLDRVPSGSSWLGNLRKCGAFSSVTDEIPAAILAAIDNSSSGPHHFVAHLAN